MERDPGINAHAYIHSCIRHLPLPSLIQDIFRKVLSDLGPGTKTIQMSVSSELPEQLTSGLDLQEKETIWFPPRLVAPQSLGCWLTATLPGPLGEDAKLQWGLHGLFGW